jgi:hypothetical protein
MAIYRLEAKIISRGNGHSAVAAAAYRTGTKIRDERADKIHDYSSRTKGVVESVILRPEHSPEWTAKTPTLWNAVELGEKRKDAQLSREFILAVPKELSAKEQFEAAVGWAQSELVSGSRICRDNVMNYDPLAPYRKVPLASAGTPAPAEAEKYVAFDTKDKVFRLRIRNADDSICAPGYNILLNLLYDKQGTHFRPSTGSSSGRISFSGAPAKMGLPAIPKPSRTITA